jgi:hypothetical protein
MTTVVDDFVPLVRQYVELVERASDTTAHAFLHSCARVFPRIYAAGAELPEVEPTDEDVTAEVESPLLRLRRLLGQYDLYSEVFDPYGDEPAGVASLADDLADIYLDLARPLLIFERGRTTDAVWEWKFNVRGHGGDHLVDAMCAIHRAVNAHMRSDYVAGDERAG